MPHSRINRLPNKEQRRRERQNASGVLRILWEDSRGDERISYATLVNSERACACKFASRSLRASV
jgi:hypothetical protein